MVRLLKVCLVGVILACGVEGYAQSLFEQGKEVGRVQFKGLDEISGMVSSRKNPGVFWVHNDSGDKAQVYAIDVRGRLLTTFLVTGATARDWEDIAVGPGPEAGVSYLYMGDTGDNNAKYKSIKVYRVPEPEVSLTNPKTVDRTAMADTIELTYPEHAYDAETLFVDPLTKDLFIVTKRETANKLFCAPYPQATDKVTELTYKVTLPTGFAVGGDVSQDGRFILVRTMFGAVMFERSVDKPVWEAFKNAKGIPVKTEPQGEAIAFDLEGNGYYTVSEGKNQPIYYYERVKTDD